MKIRDIVNEVSLGSYEKKAALDRAMSAMDKGLGQGDAEKLTHRMARREKGLASAAKRRASASATMFTPSKPDMSSRKQELKQWLDSHSSDQYADEYSVWKKWDDANTEYNRL